MASYASGGHYGVHADFVSHILYSIRILLKCGTVFFLLGTFALSSSTALPLLV